MLACQQYDVVVIQMVDDVVPLRVQDAVVKGLVIELLLHLPCLAVRVVADAYVEGRCPPNLLSDLGSYFMYRGEMSGSTGLISRFSVASSIRREICAELELLTPNISRRLAFVAYSPSPYLR